MERRTLLKCLGLTLASITASVRFPELATAKTESVMTAEYLLKLRRRVERLRALVGNRVEWHTEPETPPSRRSVGELRLRIVVTGAKLGKSGIDLARSLSTFREMEVQPHHMEEAAEMISMLEADVATARARRQQLKPSCRRDRRIYM